MKLPPPIVRYLAMFILGMAIAGRAFADSMTIAETMKDNTVGGIYSLTTDGGTFNASLTVPGLSSLSADAWSNLTCSVSSLNTNSTYLGTNLIRVATDINPDPGGPMSDAPSFGGTITTTSATFYLQSSDTNGNPVNVYKITFSRSGNTFTMAAQTINPPAYGFPPYSFLAQNYYDLSGAPSFRIQDLSSCEVTLVDGSGTIVNGSGEFDLVKTIYITGTNSITYDSQSNELNNITVSGTADFTPPTLTSVSPTGSPATTNALLTVTVKATDNYGVSNVEFYVGGADYGAGILGVSNLWSMNFSLLPGANLIQTLATDNNGNNSTTNSLTVTYANKQTNANLVTFSEHWMDSSQSNNPGNYGASNVVSQDVGVLNVACAVPGLKSMTAETWSNLMFSIAFADLFFSDSLTNADIITATSATFYLDPSIDNNGNPINLEQLTLSRSGNTLVVAVQTGSATYLLPDDLAAPSYFGWGGPIQDSQPFGMMLSDGTTAATYANISQSMFIAGTDSANYDADGNQLNNIQLSGFVDFVPPTNQITAPTPALQVSNANYTVTGKAGDNVAVSDVFFQLNNGGWNLATTVNGWTNWSVPVALSSGTNTLQAFAVDSSGNASTTNTVKVVYVLSARLTVNTAGLGTISQNYNGALLQIGKTFSMTATPASGFKFTGWTGSLATNGVTLTFTMASNLFFTADFVDTNPPTLSITNLTSGQHVSNALFTVRGTARDNWLVSNVTYQVNGLGWTNAQTANHWTNWTALANLVPGTNRFQAFATDTSGNLSTTDTLSFFYVASALLQIQTTGLGRVSPNYSNALLAVGQNYSITSSPALGFVFTNWVVSTNWVGGAVIGKTNLQFMMVSNLTLQANFVEVTKPIVTITAPAANQKMPGAIAAVTGTATDNWKVAGVWFQLNGGAWSVAPTTNNWANWNKTVTLMAGTNTVKAYALDLGGNYSLTNSVSFVSSNTFNLQLVFTNAVPLKPNGLVFSLQLSTGLNGHIQVSTNLTSWATLTNFVGTNSMVTFRDPAATNSSHRYYRAVIP